MDDGKVTFIWKDYRKHAAPKTMTLSVDEFMRRFLLHVLPDGFQRIRHFGFLANVHRKAKLALIRGLLNPVAQPPAVAAGTDKTDCVDKTTPAASTPLCPCCGGAMAVIEILPGPRRYTRQPTHRRNDTS